ncbi:MAG: YkgJ family cysteine cluster protein [Planctomycetota bacterium]
MPDLPVISCDNCGACCMKMGHPPFFWSAGMVTVDEFWVSMPADIREELQSYLNSLEDPTADVGQPCFWLDMQTKKCRHYEHRPQPCRDVEIGSPPCRTARADFQII